MDVPNVGVEGLDQTDPVRVSRGSQAGRVQTGTGTGGRGGITEHGGVCRQCQESRTTSNVLALGILAFGSF